MKTTVATICFIIMMNCHAFSEQAMMYDNRPKITVTGEAVIYVKPDKILISLGIETWDIDINQVKQKNNDILKKTISAMKQLGIPEKEIQTDHLSIEPRWKTDYRKEDFIGYFVRNNLIVTIYDINKTEEVVSRAFISGVNYLHDVDFQTTELKKYREEARELALKAAKEKAEKMAGVLGQSIGSPIQINETFSGMPWRYFSSWDGWGRSRSSGMSQVNVQADRNNSEEIKDSIALEKISIRANVSVTFELNK